MKILSFLSAKGGVGKSVISANFAYLLAKNYKTAIIDCQNFSSLDVIFKISATKNFSDFLEQKCEFSEILNRISDNLSLVIYGENSGENFENLVENLKNLGFDFIIIDANSGLSALNFEILKLSNEAILISLAEPVSISSTYAFIKVANSVKMDFLLLINECENESEAIFIYENLQKIAKANIKNELNLKLLGAISPSLKLIKSAKNRRILAEYFPNTMAVFEIKNSLNRLLKKYNLQMLDTSNFRGFGGFLRRILD